MADAIHAPDDMETPEDRFRTGLVAFQASNWEEAIEQFGQALQAKVEAIGGEADECAELYFHYGAALFHKAQEESDVFGASIDSNIPQSNAARSSNGAGPSSGAGPSTAEPVENGGNTHDDGNPEGEHEEADEEGEAEEDDDMQLAWENLEVAKTIYERNKELHRDRLSDTYTLLADLAMEQESFESAAEDYKRAKEIILSSQATYELFAKIAAAMQFPDRRLAELHFKVGLALQFLQKPEEALKEIDAAVEICKKSLDAMPGSEQPGSTASEKEGLQAVLEDLKAKQEELRQAVEEMQKQKETIQNALRRALGGAAAGGAAAGASTSQPASSKVVDLGMVGQGRRRINLAPVQQAPEAAAAAVSNAEGIAKPKRTLEDLMGGGHSATTGSLSDPQTNGSKKQRVEPQVQDKAEKSAIPKALGKRNQAGEAGTSSAQQSEK